MRGPASFRVFLCAAEASGDDRGARLVREWKARFPETTFVGLGGPKIAAEGVAVGPDLTDASTIGWFDHWRAAPRYVSALKWVRRTIRHSRPDAVVVIDAPGLGFPTARFARSLHIPVIYYVTPQTWLWNPASSTARLRRHADVVVPVFEREASLYRQSGLDVVYHGHPLLDDLEPRIDPPHRAHHSGRQTVAIVPGSRRHAIRRLLPSMLEAAALMRDRMGMDAQVSVATDALRSEIGALVGRSPLPKHRLAMHLGDLLDESRVAIAASGSNLLEAVAKRVPAVVCYRVDDLSWAIADYVMGLRSKVPAFAIPNLLAEEPVLPELIQHDVTGERIARHAMRLARDGPARDAVLQGYERIMSRLGEPGVTGRVVEDIAARLGLVGATAVDREARAPSGTCGSKPDIIPATVR